MTFTACSICVTGWWNTWQKGTLVGQNAHQGSSIAFLFLRNLALRALGADVRFDFRSDCSCGGL